MTSMSDQLSNSLSSTDERDPTARARKRDHIELAFKSQVANQELDTRFFYEPLLAGHPQVSDFPALPFLGKTMKWPIWVSSMTGGTEWARTINHNLAKACGEFGIGMGRGSCRSLLYSDDTLPDFSVRHLMGDQPLYANLGIAQIEDVLDNKESYRIDELIKKLEVDGLIIHVNPFQEWLQPEGDRFKYPPLDTIQRVIDLWPELPIIVKEVGQGMGRESLKALMTLPIQAIDFGANGGTNFARLELLRSDELNQKIYHELALVGHSANDMVNMVNDLKFELGDHILCNEFIISGGVKSFLDGYYLTEKIQMPAIYGQASSFLQHARGAYANLQAFMNTQIQGLALANSFLAVR